MFEDSTDPCLFSTPWTYEKKSRRESSNCRTLCLYDSLRVFFERKTPARKLTCVSRVRNGDAAGHTALTNRVPLASDMSSCDAIYRRPAMDDLRKGGRWPGAASET
jgi:hypothetical protein